MEKLIHIYKDSLIWLCVYSAQIQKFSEMAEKGCEVPRRKLVYAMGMASQYKARLLEYKERLGFTDGLEFMSDRNKFIGFGVEKGIFSGDSSAVLDVCDKWIKGFPESANNYQYEVSVFAYCLSHPELKKHIYPKDLYADREE